VALAKNLWKLSPYISTFVTYKNVYNPQLPMHSGCYFVKYYRYMFIKDKMIFFYGKKPQKVLNVRGVTWKDGKTYIYNI
jgi:hypothetical protein